MDENRKSETKSIKKKHFAKFHERVQNKYAEMQRKLEQSRSFESISSLADDFVINQNNKEIEEARNENKLVKYNMVVEEINKQDATLQDNESAVFESEITPAIQENGDNDMFFGNNFNLSLESITEACKEQKVTEDVPSTPNRISIRNRIGTRISAVKERRREKKVNKKDAKEKVEKLILCNTPAKPLEIRVDSLKKKNKIASVIIALINATEMESQPALEEKPRHLYYRIRLGPEKYKSKVVKSKRKVVSWKELFQLGVFDDTLLEITIWEKDILVGRCSVDLSALEKEKTHRMRLDLEESTASIQIFLLLTISGMPLENTLLDLDDYQKSVRENEERKKQFSTVSINNDNTQEVGWLSVIVYGAKGLSLSNCYCVLAIDNDRVVTHTEFKTHNPNWMKFFSFKVMDVSSALEITVIDDKRSEVVGKLVIPLLRINNGEKKWYALKDSLLRDRAKGQNPRILLEMSLFYNKIGASLRVLYPREEDYFKSEPEFSRQIFSDNISRAKVVVNWILTVSKVIKTCFEWESTRMNLFALTIWLLFWWFYKQWMLPLLLLVPFVRYQSLYELQDNELIATHFTVMTGLRKLSRNFSSASLLRNSSSKLDLTKDEKSQTIRQRIHSLTDVIKFAQNIIGKAAGIGESVKNLCNFTVPFLSNVAITFILMTTFILFFIPARYLFMAWGIHKFLRKLIRPNRIPNNEILDLLSRVPDDVTLQDWHELPLLELTETDEGETNKS